MQCSHDSQQDAPCFADASIDFIGHEAASLTDASVAAASFDFMGHESPVQQQQAAVAVEVLVVVYATAAIPSPKIIIAAINNNNLLFISIYLIYLNTIQNRIYVDAGTQNALGKHNERSSGAFKL